MKPDFMMAIDREFLKDFSAGGAQSAMKKHQSMTDIKNHAQGINLSCNAIGETMLTDRSIERRVEEWRYPTTFTSSFAEFCEARARGELCYQAEPLDKNVLAPVLMAMFLDIWDEMVNKQSWPTEQPSIIKLWLKETSDNNHGQLHAWLDENYTKPECVTFNKRQGKQPSDNLIFPSHLQPTSNANTDSTGLRIGCTSGSKGNEGRWVTFTALQEELQKPEHKAIRDAYTKTTGISLDFTKLKIGIAQKFGKMKDKGPQYHPNGDNKRERRDGQHYPGIQSKVEAIAEAKALGCVATFKTGYPPIDKDGSKTEPMTPERLKEITTPYKKPQPFAK